MGNWFKEEGKKSARNQEGKTQTFKRTKREKKKRCTKRTTLCPQNFDHLEILEGELNFNSSLSTETC